MTYKLASTDGHLLGAVTQDGSDAIAGKVGPRPRSFPLRIVARNRAGEVMGLDSLLADERHLGFGAGLSFVAPLGVTQALGRLMRDFGPVTFRMCARFRVTGRRRPLGFCNPYFSVDDAVADLSEAGFALDFFDLSSLGIERASVSMRARAGVKQDVLIRARAPRRVRKGKPFRVRLTVQRRRGGRRQISVPVRIPGDLRPGRHRLTLRGTGSGLTEDDLIEELIAVLEGALGPGGGPSEPRSVPQLARELRTLRRRTGIQARFGRRAPRFVRRSGVVSYEGRVRLRVRVMPRARR